MNIRLEKFLFFILILLLPSQLAFHFWPAWSFVSGIRVDYLSPTFYLTDLVILSLLLLWLIRCRFCITLNKYFVTFSIFAFFNILISSLPWLTFFSWLHYLEYFLFSCYIYFNRSLLLPHLSLPLSLSLIWVSLLAWLQFYFQHSLGGMWYWLGERTFSVTSPLVAKISLGNFGLFLRPYSTFPHPNALAAFLLLGVLIILYLNPKFSPRLLLIPLITIPLTFSRTIVILELLAISIYVLKTYFPKIIKPLLIILIPILGFAYFLIQYIGNPDSLPERFYLLQKAFRLIISHPIFGVGLNNFIPSLFTFPSSFSLLSFQPVHNIFLLIGSESGIPLLILIIYLLLKTMIKINNWRLLIPILAVLFSSFLDHYWLTLHQNTLLLTILISLLVIKFKNDY